MSSTLDAADRAGSLFRVLAQPSVDRTIAFVAILPLLYLTYLRYQHWGAGHSGGFTCDRNADCVCDDGRSQAAKENHTKSLVLTARICGHVLVGVNDGRSP